METTFTSARCLVRRISIFLDPSRSQEQASKFLLAHLALVQEATFSLRFANWARVNFRAKRLPPKVHKLRAISILTLIFSIQQRFTSSIQKASSVVAVRSVSHPARSEESSPQALRRRSLKRRLTLRGPSSLTFPPSSRPTSRSITTRKPD